MYFHPLPKGGTLWLLLAYLNLLHHPSSALARIQENLSCLKADMAMSSGFDW